MQLIDKLSLQEQLRLLIFLVLIYIFQGPTGAYQSMFLQWAGIHSHPIPIQGSLFLSTFVLARFPDYRRKQWLQFSDEGHALRIAFCHYNPSGRKTGVSCCCLLNTVLFSLKSKGHDRHHGEEEPEWESE